MNKHNTVYRSIKRVVADPLEVLEARASNSPWHHALRGALYVMARPDGTYSYQWGDASISRNEAARRARQ